MDTTTLLHATRRALPVILAITLGACGSHSSSEETPLATARCGDGQVDVGEECDGADLAGRSCRSFKRDSAGTLACDASCRLDTHDCTDPSCGNGVVDASVAGAPELCEQCDGAALDGRSCAGFRGTGTLVCSNGCTFDRTSCDGICGNGRLDPAEACDVDSWTYQPILPAGLSCDALGLGGGELYCGFTGGSVETPFGRAVAVGCELNTYNCEHWSPEGTCGNGRRESPEECDGDDLGGTTCEELGVSGDLGCTSDCRYDFAHCARADGPAECGNGVVEAGEECDGNHFAPLFQSDIQSGLLDCELNALFNTGRELCDASCRIDRGKCGTIDFGLRCGNGVAEGYEECDGTDLRGLACADLGGSGELRCDYCSLDRSSCRDVALNGRREESEACDFTDSEPYSDVGDATCQSLGYGDGALACTLLRRSWRTQPPWVLQDQVLFPRLATYACTQPGVCGDGRATDGEECDGEDLAGASCTTFDAAGELHCTSGCRFDLTGCRSKAECGDGHVSFGEDCEPSSPRVSCSVDGGTGAYTCDPQFCFMDATGCSFACTR